MTESMKLLLLLSESKNYNYNSFTIDTFRSHRTIKFVFLTSLLVLNIQDTQLH